MYLVLGGTGLIGHSLVKRLSRKKKVRVLARHMTSIFHDMDVEMVYGDFSRIDMGKLLEGVDTVFHLISSSMPADGVEGMKDDIVKDFLPTIQLLDMMGKKGIPTIYFVSSGGTVYGELDDPANEKNILRPQCAYAVSKVYLEQCLSMYSKYCGICAFILRVGNPYGIDRFGKKQGIIPIFTKKIVDGETIEVWGDGTNRRDYIFIEEVIDAMEAVEQYNGNERIFNIGTGISTSTIRIINILSEELQKDVKIRFLPKRACDVQNSCMDVSLIKNECHWKSSITIERGIQIYLREWRKNLL